MTKISWTEQTWNPIVGCDIESKGCTNCYAMKMAGRIQKMNRTNEQTGYVNHYDGTTKVVNGKVVWTGKVAQAPDKTLLAPLGRKKPTTYFVNSMGDMFHPNVPDEWIDRVFAVMALCPQHIFQILTKHAARMREYMNSLSGEGMVEIWAMQAGRLSGDAGYDDVMQYHGRTWPLPNVWLGVSTEDQQRWNERWYHLARTPAAIRFVSGEPLLGPIDMIGNGKLDWLICGGESGTNARPMHPDWARSLRDQCVAAGVPFHFKQWGEWKPLTYADMNKYWPTDTASAIGLAPDGSYHVEGQRMQRVGTKHSGNLLDGRVWDQMPEVGA